MRAWSSARNGATGEPDEPDAHALARSGATIGQDQECGGVKGRTRLIAMASRHRDDLPGGVGAGTQSFLHRQRSAVSVLRHQPLPGRPLHGLRDRIADAMGIREDPMHRLPLAHDIAVGSCLTAMWRAHADGHAL